MAMPAVVVMAVAVVIVGVMVMPVLIMALVVLPMIRIAFVVPFLSLEEHFRILHCLPSQPSQLPPWPA